MGNRVAKERKQDSFAGKLKEAPQHEKADDEGGGGGRQRWLKASGVQLEHYAPPTEAHAPPPLSWRLVCAEMSYDRGFMDARAAELRADLFSQVHVHSHASRTPEFTVMAKQADLHRQAQTLHLKGNLVVLHTPTKAELRAAGVAWDTATESLALTGPVHATAQDFRIDTEGNVLWDVNGKHIKVDGAVNVISQKLGYQAKAGNAQLTWEPLTVVLAGNVDACVGHVCFTAPRLRWRPGQSAESIITAQKVRMHWRRKTRA
eukprot:jgi/Chlat1/851/Chrsp104S01187